MKRLFISILLGVLLSACMHPWVGRPVGQLEKEMGRPYSIRFQGSDKVYVYPDTLAGRGQMTFTVDRGGIIRSWYATTDVPGPFGTDVFGNGANDVNGGFGTTNTNGGRSNGGLSGPFTTAP